MKNPNNYTEAKKIIAYITKSIGITIDVAKGNSEDEILSIDNWISIYDTPVDIKTLIEIKTVDGFSVVCSEVVHSSHWDQPDDVDENEIYKGRNLESACLIAVKELITRKLDDVMECFADEQLARELEGIKNNP